MIALVLAGTAGAVWMSSCGDGAVEPPPPPAPVATTVTVNPGSAALSALGETARFTADVRDQNGQVMAGAAIAWASSDASVATVGASGVATAAANGSATITATAGSAAGTAAVTVAQVVTAVAVSPAADTLVAFGDTVRLEAEATDANGHAVEAVTEFVWSSSDTLVARVDDTGLVTGVDEGMATITAVTGEYSGAAEITTVENTDRNALVALYNATDGPNWVDNTNWLSDAPLGEWYGVETDASGRVVRLSLPDNRLVGIIPADVGRLAKLTHLSFWENQLWGTIPAELGRLANLRALNLGWNLLTGEIPPEFGALTKLQTLMLRNNSLTGPIPMELGNLTELRYLHLYSNELSGPIPMELGNLTELQVLSLLVNELTGGIPVELANLSELRDLSLGSNQLTGPIPAELGNLVNLTRLALWDNNLTGPIPPELGNLTRLEGLAIGNNDLTGPIPPELGNLVNLSSASFGGNRLTGAVPRSLLQLDSLQTLGCAQSDGVCVPATAEFREWVRAVEARSVGRSWVDIPWCDETEKLVLEALYEATDGPEWTSSDGWLEDEDLARWHGVSTDSATGRISGLDLTGNGLSGGLPQALGQLVGMTQLKIGSNALSGRLPVSLAELPLEELDYRDTSLCVVDDPAFESWLSGIAVHRGTGAQCPPLTERDVLELLYRNTGGSGWSQRGGWLTGAPLSEWDGIETDASGRVVALTLRDNRLTGSIPAELGQLPELRSLDLYYNRLSGSIPPELGDLDRLEQLDLSRNELSGSLPIELGKLSELQILDLRSNELSGPIPAELGDLDRLERLILGWNQFTGEIPVELGQLSELRDVRLSGNNLSGSIPVEIGDLSRLDYLALSQNQLSGEIPEQFGRLDELRFLRLYDNRLTGAIPSGVANLARLERLDLSRNRLTGAIPSSLGDLENLIDLHLGDNQLAGPLPVELGRAGSLERLDLRSNALAGQVPAEYSNLGALKELILAHNPELGGPLPEGFTELSRLERLVTGGTGVCRPTDPGFDAWFGAIPHGYVARCREGPSVYLTQTTQSWEDPVPLLAGEPALLRVFVSAPAGSDATMPDVEASFHVDGSERHSVRIPASAKTIPAEVVEGDLALSVNAEIPAEVIVPGLEMVIEVDPDRALEPALGVTKRIPEAGRMPVDVRAVPPFQLTLIPFLWEGVSDSSIVQSVNEMVDDAAGGHELFRDVRTLLPVVELSVAAHEPVAMSHSNANQLLAQIEAMRLMEGGSGYWMGVLKRRPGARSSWFPGQARLDGHVSYAMPPNASTIAHELGHNLGLLHAPCGNPGGVDPWFPHPAGRIGAWGFNFERSVLVRPTTPDFMSYCGSGNEWVSDYNFNKTLAYRLANDGAAAAAMAAEADPERTLLLWGGRDEDGVPYLDPAFVVDAVPSLPVAGGDYTIEGATADGTPVFSLAFDMPAIADAQGEETSFVFALPVQSDWGDSLASITLSGPRGSAVLDETTNRPMAILRDPRTGQVRGFLRDPPPATQAAADAVGSAARQGLETLFSRGIPDAGAWWR
ncbi:MAG: Ig-like domain-containing protein [bacterium]|nr:Ig-like domain-containing protein [bacterium]